jgi:hypothetical protein
MALDLQRLRLTNKGAVMKMTSKQMKQMKSKSTSGAASNKKETPQKSESASGSSEKVRSKNDAASEKSPMKHEHKGCC